MIDTKRLATDAAYWDEVAPEGATHIDGNAKVFIKRNGRDWLHYLDGEWLSFAPVRRAISRPTKPQAPEWDGELPPPSTVVEYAETDEEWQLEGDGPLWREGDEIEILGYRANASEETTAVCWNVTRKKAGQRLPVWAGRPAFRPIRTKEQRERDELAHLLCPALRQLRHNSSDGFVPAFDYEETLAILSCYNLELKP